MPSLLRRLIQLPAMLAVCLTATALPAAAQDSVLATSPALACLTRLPGAPATLDYPPAALARKEGGVMRVALEFTGPDQPPHVVILSRPPLGNFDSAMEAHLAAFRVPCMRAGDALVRLSQEYHFDPDQQYRVVASQPRDDADPERTRQLACMVHRDGKARPDFPREARQREEQGTIIMRLRFTRPDAPPEVETVQSQPSHSLRQAVLRHLAGFRVPCLGAQPLETIIAFKYVYDGGARTLLRDSTLIEVLAAARDLQKPVHFDFKTMDCPFELRMAYRQPFAANRVDQLDSAVAERAPLLQWLEGLHLDMDNRASANIFNNKFVIAVPCGQLDL